jgi:predicted ester cyclase
MTSIEENKRIAMRTANELVCEGRLDLVEEIIHPDYRYRGPVRLTAVGPGGYRSFVTMLLAAFSDLSTNVRTLTGEGDWVTMAFDASGKNTGEIFGQPASGNSVDFGGIIMCRIADGKVIEQFEMFDFALLMQQLGLAPETPAQEFR